MCGIRTTEITFDPFFQHPKIKGKSDAVIERLIGLKTDTVKAMRNREDVSFDTIWRICHVLECQPGDIMAAEPVYLVLTNDR
ncbi:MAG: Cro/C1-type DNA-binding domain [Sporomusa sp.]|jgi:DNA-binding Xre family transcriptional regulator|nr:Cro/C1-type DNA-binding domain [Sporomusa sp.]